MLQLQTAPSDVGGVHASPHGVLQIDTGHQGLEARLWLISQIQGLPAMRRQLITLWAIDTGSWPDQRIDGPHIRAFSAIFEFQPTVETPALDC